MKLILLFKLCFIVFVSWYQKQFALTFTKKKVNMKNALIYTVLKNCQQGKLPVRINVSPNKPLSTPYQGTGHLHLHIATRNVKHFAEIIRQGFTSLLIRSPQLFDSIRVSWLYRLECFQMILWKRIARFMYCCKIFSVSVCHVLYTYLICKAYPVM